MVTSHFCSVPKVKTEWSCTSKWRPYALLTPDELGWLIGLHERIFSELFPLLGVAEWPQRFYKWICFHPQVTTLPEIHSDECVRKCLLLINWELIFVSNLTGSVPEIRVISSFRKKIYAVFGKSGGGQNWGLRLPEVYCRPNSVTVRLPEAYCRPNIVIIRLPEAYCRLNIVIVRLPEAYCRPNSAIAFPHLDWTCLSVCTCR
jgi:hypothetical protein